MEQRHGAPSKVQARGAGVLNPLPHQDACAGQLVLCRGGLTLGSPRRSQQLREDEQGRSAAYLPRAHPTPGRLGKPASPAADSESHRSPEDGRRPCGLNIPVLHSFVSSLHPAPDAQSLYQVSSHLMPMTS